MKKLLLLLLLLQTKVVTGQTMLRLQHINVDDGLSQSSVNYIFQDSRGFMWFATGDGLDRYDGKEFIAYKSRFNDTLSWQMRDRNINSNILEDSNHKLWLGTDGGISFIDTRGVNRKLMIENHEVQNDATLLGIDGDTLWATVNQDGLYAFSTSTFRYNHYRFTDTFQRQPDKVYPVYDGALTKTGIYLADRAGLLYIDKISKAEKRLIINKNFTSLCMLHDGHILMTAAGGVYIYDTAKRTLSFQPINSNTKKPVFWSSCVEDAKANTVYLSGINSGSICKINLANQHYEFLSFQNNPINHMFIDASQNLWIGTEGNGVFKLDIKPPNFFCYTPLASVHGDPEESFMVKSIFREDSGDIWLGTYNQGLFIYHPAAGTLQSVPLGLPSAALSVTSLFKSQSGYIALSAGSRIIWLDPHTRKVIRSVMLPVFLTSSPEPPIIYALTEWKKDHYLAGTNMGVFSISLANGIEHESDPYIFRTNMHLSGHIYGLTPEGNGIIDVGKRNGFARIRMVNDSVISVLEQGFEHIPFRHFYRSTSTPTLWMGSEKGLVAFNENTKQYKIFDESSGLANSFIYAILPYNDSTLWISTNKGLALAKVSYGDCSNIKASFTNFTVKDGLQSNEFNTGAYFKAGDGTFFFGGIAGINWFKPGDVKPNPYYAKPAIAGIFVNDILLSTDSSQCITALTLPYRSNTVSFVLRSLEYTCQEQNQFSYKLEGLDKDWVVTANDKVRYSNLPPGTYNFLLKVSNNEGMWNKSPLKMQLTILPPYWQTWWFRVLLVLAAGGGVYLTSRSYAMKKIRDKTRELEKQQALYLERLRISKDVHDDLGSGLSKISLMAEIAQKRNNGDESLTTDIRHISSVSKELVDNMRDLIWVLNPDNTTLEQLVARLREYCSDYLENIPINVTLDFPDKIPDMRIAREAQRNIFLTTKEAINNCIKHAHATELRIRLRIDNGKFSVTVSDNGKGFDLDGIKGSGNGLRNMKQRIELIGGRFVIASVTNSTTLTMTIPLSEMAVEKNTTKM